MPPTPQIPATTATRLPHAVHAQSGCSHPHPPAARPGTTRPQQQSTLARVSSTIRPTHSGSIPRRPPALPAPSTHARGSTRSDAPRLRSSSPGHRRTLGQGRHPALTLRSAQEQSPPHQIPAPRPLPQITCSARTASTRLDMDAHRPQLGSPPPPLQRCQHTGFEVHPTCSIATPSGHSGPPPRFCIRCQEHVHGTAP